MNARSQTSPPRTRETTRDRPSALRATRSRDGTIEVRGDLDAGSASTLDRALVWHEDALQSEHGNPDQPVTVDLSGVGFVDSSGLRSLVAASVRATRRGSRVVLRNVGPDLVRLLEITGLAEHFGVRPPPRTQATHGDPHGVNTVERRYGTDESPT